MARYGVVVFSIVMMAATVVLAGDTNLSVAVKGGVGAINLKVV